MAPATAAAVAAAVAAAAMAGSAEPQSPPAPSRVQHSALTILVVFVPLQGPAAVQVARGVVGRGDVACGNELRSSAPMVQHLCESGAQLGREHPEREDEGLGGRRHGAGSVQGAGMPSPGPRPPPSTPSEAQLLTHPVLATVCTNELSEAPPAAEMAGWQRVVKGGSSGRPTQRHARTATACTHGGSSMHSSRACSGTHSRGMHSCGMRAAAAACTAAAHGKMISGLHPLMRRRPVHWKVSHMVCTPS